MPTGIVNMSRLSNSSQSSNHSVRMTLGILGNETLKLS